MTVVGLDAPLEVCPPLAGVVRSVAITVYPLMVAPPLETGGVQDTTDLELANEVAVTPVGAPATVEGVAETGLDAGPSPMALVATTVKV